MHSPSLRREKNRGGERKRSRTRAHVYGRPVLRIAYARACICKRAAWGDETTARQSTRGTEATRDEIRTRKRETARRVGGGEGESEWEGGSGWPRRRRRGWYFWCVGTSDSNYLELRASDPPGSIRGFLALTSCAIPLCSALLSYSL